MDPIPSTSPSTKPITVTNFSFHSPVDHSPSFLLVYLSYPHPLQYSSYFFVSMCSFLPYPFTAAILFPHIVQSFSLPPICLSQCRVSTKIPYNKNSTHVSQYAQVHMFEHSFIKSKTHQTFSSLSITHSSIIHCYNWCNLMLFSRSVVGRKKGEMDRTVRIREQQFPKYGLDAKVCLDWHTWSC